MIDRHSASAAGDAERAAAAQLLQPGAELAVIIPTFNEAGNVDLVLERLSAALSGLRWEVLFVDDDSPDGTAALVRARCAEDSRVRILHRIGRRGLSSAVIEGMLATSAPFIAVMDGDLQHDESLLPRMLQIVRSGECDVAVGSRYVDGGGVGEWSALRRAASNMATRISKLIYSEGITDPMSGFFLIRRDALDGAVRQLSGTGFKILLDILASSPRKLELRELPYEFRLRRTGESKLDASVVLEFLLLILDKKVGRIVPPRFILFAAVGGSGLVVHLACLWSALRLMGGSFPVSQAVATVIAMSWNYALNNAITFRAERRKGWRFLTGLLSFYVVCSIGVIANVGIAQVFYANNAAWWISGIAGALVGSVWNYAVSSVYTWRK